MPIPDPTKLVIVEVLPHRASHSVNISIIDDNWSLFLPITKEDASKLANFLFYKYKDGTGPIWIGPTITGLGCRVEWSSSDYVTMRVFDLNSTHQGRDFVLEAFVATHLSETIISKLSEASIPVVGIDPVDPLMGAKKRMNDNLRRVFG